MGEHHRQVTFCFFKCFWSFETIQRKDNYIEHLPQLFKIKHFQLSSSGEKTLPEIMTIGWMILGSSHVMTQGKVSWNIQVLLKKFLTQKYLGPRPIFALSCYVNSFESLIYVMTLISIKRRFWMSTVHRLLQCTTIHGPFFQISPSCRQSFLFFAKCRGTENWKLLKFFKLYFPIENFFKNICFITVQILIGCYNGHSHFKNRFKSCAGSGSYYLWSTSSQTQNSLRFTKKIKYWIADTSRDESMYCKYSWRRIALKQVEWIKITKISVLFRM